MHVLLCVEDDAADRPVPTPPGTASEGDVPEAGVPAGGVATAWAAALAAAWTDGAPGCTVEPLVLPAAPGDVATPGVFVPVSSLGLTRVAEQVSAATARLRAQVQDADVAVVAVPVLDGDTLHGGAVAAVADAASAYAVPVVVLAETVAVTRREWSGAGVSGVHELGDLGRGEARDGAPDGPRDLPAVARVARTWAPGWA